LDLGQFQRIDEDLERDMYALVLDHLEAAGFEHYEVSNWARRDARTNFRCLHNLQYWHNANWLGVGPSAASHIDGYRWKNLPHLGHYLDQRPEPPITDMEHLPAVRRVGEELMLRLRLREGASEVWLEQNLAADDPRRQTIRYMTGLGMLEHANGNFRLTRQGLFVADAVIKELL
jgi:oxygen-independent coproporphyrinogen-3 oxidase